MKKAARSCEPGGFVYAAELSRDQRSQHAAQKVRMRAASDGHYAGFAFDWPIMRVM